MRGSAGNKSTPIQIYDVSLDVIRHLLFHLYWGKVAGDDLKCHAKEIIDTADRYSVVDLKLESEACLVVENKVKVNRKIPFNYSWGFGQRCFGSKGGEKFSVNQPAEPVNQIHL